MQTRERHVSRVERSAVARAAAAEALVADAKATSRQAKSAERAAERQIEAAALMAAKDRIAADASAAALAEMREDRDRWRAQAERLAGALERLKAEPRKSAPPAAACEATEADTLYGVPAIAKAFRLKVRQVYHLKAEHGLPTFKVGRIVCARRDAVAAWLAGQESTVTTDGAR